MQATQSHSPSKTGTLKRVIGPFSAMLLVVGTMIGTGVYKKIAPMAATGADATTILLAWCLAGVVTVFGALSVIPLARLTDASGGQYEYIRMVYGDLMAFILGWASFTVIGSASAAAMAHLFASSVGVLFPDTLFQEAIWQKVISCALIVLLTLFNFLGARESTLFNNFLAFIKIAGVLLLIIGAFFYDPPSGELSASAAGQSGSITNVGVSVFFMMMLSAFWAYDGWLNVSFVSGEIRDPVRTLPKALFFGIVLVMGLYLAVNLAYLHVLPASVLARVSDQQIAASVVSESLFGAFGAWSIAVIILLSALGSLNGNIITYSRMYYKMGTDGLFFPKTGTVHVKSGTPRTALLYGMGMSCLLVFAGSFDVLTDMIVFAGFLFYALMAAGVFLHRKKMPMDFRYTGYPIVPVVFILFSLFLVGYSIVEKPYEALLGLLLISTAIPVYFMLKKKNHKNA
jgi:APA family basic amino acid/polyamine antiporter